MCGILGVYEWGSGRPVAGAALRSMQATIVHRGPDAAGCYQGGEVGLASRRLSIIDPEGGQQPIFNEDKSVVLVFNGEIYNYQELRSGLRRAGHRFATRTDSEVVVHLYEDLGDACIERLRGMFAFALWDVRRRRLLVARDRLGIKPIYYCQAGHRLVVGSEIKTVVAHPGVDVHLDREALGEYLVLKYVPAPGTFFDGIRALPPGHLLTCDRRGVSVRRYWDLTFRQPRPGLAEEEAAEELATLLEEAVRLHLMSDVPYGAFLSGGLDSSTVVALMSREIDGPVRTFSVGFKGRGKGESELAYARTVARHCGTDHHEVLIDGRDLVDLAERVVWHLDQPIADPAAVATYAVSALAARHVKMVLTGEGGDELFAGYARYAGERLAPIMGRVPAGISAWLVEAVSRMPGLRRAKLALGALTQPDELGRVLHWFPLFAPDAAAEILGRRPERRAVDAARRVFAEHLARADGPDVLSRMLYVDTKLWLADDLLARGDKMSMAVSLEARVPLLDHRLVEFAASLPSHLKLKGHRRKHLLKRVSRAWLPAAIVNRPKKGFPIPVSTWFRHEAREFVHDLLSPSALSRRGLFDQRAVGRLLAEHDSGFADHGSQIWGLLSVELWHRLYVDSAFGRRPAPGPDRVTGATGRSTVLPATPPPDAR